MHRNTTTTRSLRPRQEDKRQSKKENAHFNNTDAPVVWTHSNTLYMLIILCSWILQTIGHNLLQRRQNVINYITPTPSKILIACTFLTWAWKPKEIENTNFPNKFIDTHKIEFVVVWHAQSMSYQCLHIILWHYIISLLDFYFRFVMPLHHLRVKILKTYCSFKCLFHSSKIRF